MDAEKLKELLADLRSKPALAVAAGGLGLCLLSLLLPWASADFLGASAQVRASGGATLGVLLGTAIGGFGVYRLLSGVRSGIAALGGGGVLNLLVAFINIADVRSASNQTFGAIDVGIGLMALFVGSLVVLGGAAAHHFGQQS